MYFCAFLLLYLSALSRVKVARKQESCPYYSPLYSQHLEKRLLWVDEFALRLVLTLLTPRDKIFYRLRVLFVSSSPSWHLFATQPLAALSASLAKSHSFFCEFLRPTELSKLGINGPSESNTGQIYQSFLSML